MDKTIRQIEKPDCCGCGACAQVCPRTCIAMREDREGFLYPVIRDYDCSSCGRCLSVCPVYDRMRRNAGARGDTDTQTSGGQGSPERQDAVALRVFAAYTRTEEIRMASSSGGIFSELAGHILAQGGVVYGAAFDGHWEVRHIGVWDREELWQLQGSKYVQSDTAVTYQEARQQLAAGRMVLYSGTPCQIAGLKRYLGKDYENLYTADILCHGTPSRALWRKYRDWRMQNRHAPQSVRHISFRSKEKGWHLFSLRFDYSDGSSCSATQEDDRFLQMFLNNICLRPACHHCRFKNLDRDSDLTLGDFWGVENLMPEMDDDRGTSLILVHTAKGDQMKGWLEKSCRIKAVSLDRALPPDAESRRSATAHRDRAKFFENLPSASIEELYRLVQPSVVKRAWKLVKKAVKKVIGEKQIKKLIRGGGAGMGP